MEPLYTAEASAKGGRDGHARSSDGVIDVDLQAPKEMGGRGGDASNPEQLFAAGYAACFQGALGVVARQEKLDVSDSTITAKVSIGKDDTGGFGLAVSLVGSLPGIDKAKAEELMEKAHQVCPYSKATRGNIDVKVSAA